MELHVFQILSLNPGTTRHGYRRPQSIETKRVGGVLINAGQASTGQDYTSRGILLTKQGLDTNANAILNNQVGCDCVSLEGNERVTSGCCSDVFRNDPTRVICFVQDAGSGMGGLCVKKV